MVGFPTIVLIVIVHLMLGFRRLRDIERYRDDPMVLRALGLRRMPNVSTVCRSLARTDRPSVENVRLLSRENVVSRLEAEKFSRVTLDFDGSVISTGKIAEGTAVGYNNKRKGERSYYCAPHSAADEKGTPQLGSKPKGDSSLHRPSLPHAKQLEPLTSRDCQSRISGQRGEPTVCSNLAVTIALSSARAV